MTVVLSLLRPTPGTVVSRIFARSLLMLLYSCDDSMLCSHCQALFFLSAERLDPMLIPPPSYGRYGCPSALETNMINTVLDALSYEVKMYDEEIHRLSCTMLDLRNGRERLLECMHRYKSTIAPIRQLPDEILLEIFSYVKGPVPSAARGWSRKDPMTRVVWDIVGVTHVCRRWRDAAISTKSFWADFLAVPHRKSPIPVYLERSVDYPLTISLFDKLPHPPHMDLLIDQCARWREVQTGFCDAPENIHIIRNKLPILEALFLSVGGETSGWNDVFENAPRLHTLVLDTHYLLNVRMPWSQITNLTLLHSTSSSNCHFILRQAANLEVAHLNIVNDGTALHPTELDYRLHLSSLTLTINGFDSATVPFLSCLTLPVLRHFNLFSRDRNDAQTLLQSTLSLLTRSSCRLESLQLSIPLACPALLTLLELTPDLTSLTLNLRHAWADDLIQRLTPSPQSIALPGLRSLALVFLPSHPQPAENALLEMIESRYRIRSSHAVSHLEKVTLRFGRTYKFSRTGKARVAQLRQEGLHLDLDTSLRLFT